MGELEYRLQQRIAVVGAQGADFADAEPVHLVHLVLRPINMLIYFEFGYFASRRDAGKIARHFSAGIMQRHKDESHRDD